VSEDGDPGEAGLAFETAVEKVCSKRQVGCVHDLRGFAMRKKLRGFGFSGRTMVWAGWAH
jgi:hypothetical protein